MKCRFGLLSCNGPFADQGAEVCYDCAVWHDEHPEEAHKLCNCQECYSFRLDNGEAQKEMN